MDDNSQLKLADICSVLKVTTALDIQNAAAAMMQLDQMLNGSPDDQDVETMAIDFFIGFGSLNCQIRSADTYHMQFPRLNVNGDPIGGFFPPPCDSFIYSKELYNFSTYFTELHHEPTRGAFVRYFEFLSKYRNKEQQFFTEQQDIVGILLQKQVGLEMNDIKRYDESMASKYANILNPEKVFFLYHLFALRPLLLLFSFLNKQNAFCGAYLFTVSYVDQNSTRKESIFWSCSTNCTYQNSFLYRILEAIERFMELDNKFKLDIDTSIFCLIGQFLQNVFDHLFTFDQIYNIGQTTIGIIKSKVSDLIIKHFDRILSIPISDFLNAYEGEEDETDTQRKFVNKTIVDCNFSSKVIIDQIVRNYKLQGCKIDDAIQKLFCTENLDFTTMIVQDLSQDALNGDFWLFNNIFKSFLPKEMRMMQVFMELIQFVIRNKQFFSFLGNRIFYYIRGISNVPHILAQLNEQYKKASQFSFNQANSYLYVKLVNCYLQFYNNSSQISMDNLESVPFLLSEEDYKIQILHIQSRLQVSHDLYCQLQQMFSALPEFTYQTVSIFKDQVYSCGLDLVKRQYLGCSYDSYLNFAASQLWISSFSTSQAKLLKITSLDDIKIIQTPFILFSFDIVNKELISISEANQNLSFTDYLYYVVVMNYAPIVKCTKNFDDECDVCWSREIKHVDFLVRQATSSSSILNISTLTHELHCEILDLLMLPKDTVLTTNHKQQFNLLQTSKHMAQIYPLPYDVYNFQNQVFIKNTSFDNVLQKLQQSNRGFIILTLKPHEYPNTFSYNSNIFEAIVKFYAAQTEICEADVAQQIKNCKIIKEACSHQNNNMWKTFYDQALSKSKCQETKTLSLLCENTQFFIVSPLDLEILQLKDKMIVVGLGCCRQFAHIYIEETI